MRSTEPASGIFFHSVLILLFTCFFGLSYSQVAPAPVHLNALSNLETGAMAPATGSTLKFPWAGGVNSCQFCAIDLNLDGIKDLLIFDRHGNRKLTFINHGTPDAIDYTFAPEYALLLPGMHDWVIAIDYNCDGKQDIFTYGMGGVRVFENISDTELKFRLVTDLLASFYYTGKVGILVTSVDYPALADIDNDGDMDLLTFFGLGSYVEYHKNLSMEKYGNCDSLDFRLDDHCWGKFKESEGGNNITLNAGCPYMDGDLRFSIYDLRFTNDKLPVRNDTLQMTNPGFIFQNPKSEIRNLKSRHTGSTLLAKDLNNDGLKDLILGDVDYPGLVALYNGGSVDSAFMVAKDTAFPATSGPVNLFSFPSVSCLDIDNDGLDDLLVSPFDPALHTSDNYNCVWFYKNTGSNSQPHFEFRSDHLFMDEMTEFGSASHPVLYDFDGDGLEDMFVGNDGYYDSSYYKDAVLHSVYTSKISYFRNTGTVAAPVFTCVTADLGGISHMKLRGAYPAFGDLDGDGRTDLLIGNSDGTIMLFLNAGSGASLPQFEAPLLHWQNIDVGEYSAPQLFDLDKDNVSELIVGEQNGNLNCYRNTGTAESPVFVLLTDSLGKVNVTNYNLSYDGFSTPCFARRTDGTTFLAAGSNEGRIHLFENIDHNLAGKFTETGGLYDWLSSTPADTLFGWQTSPAIGHLTDPGAFDLITGNFAGGLNYLTKRSPAEIIPGFRKTVASRAGSLKIFPNPADKSVTIHAADNNRQYFSGRIDNVYGQKVLEFPFNGQTTISVSALPPGMYVVHLGQSASKLIISRH
ncbi:MAG: T9SS type A sorting domain-containing protein [Bacteroidetes bacterium]|nr:T9SS type A sorting domain-containing protein [Bacteroidota bacterium]